MSYADYVIQLQISCGISMLCLAILLWLIRRDGPSFGLPFAYLSLLLLNHVPGAMVPVLNDQFTGHLTEVTYGIRLTTIGVVSFLVGVLIARFRTREQRENPLPSAPVAKFREDWKFWTFCLVGGWFFTFGLIPLSRIPSIGAVIYNGGAIWMLGVLLGLRWSVRNKEHHWTLFWLLCLMVYPVVMLIAAGFLSYGTTAGLIVMCVLVAGAKRYWRVFAVITAVGYLGLSLFSNYFQARESIRLAAWSGASVERRLDAASKIFTEWKFFDTSDLMVLAGLDLRLNQNYFLGLAAQNLDNRTVEYLEGSSVTDALLSLVPRALWPGKTVYGGSPEIVMKMTGLNLSTTTSFGVGNVMEFYINFGVYGLIIGFLSLGWAIGRFDHRAAIAEASGDYNTAMLFFLPGVALIQPLGSMVELTGSAASAWIAGYFWKWAWKRWQARKARLQPQLPEAAVH
jgi:hypothetical protein